MSHTRAAGVLLTVTLAASCAEAAERAPALVSWKRALCIYTGCFLEPLVPDLRYEWGGALKDGWVLSWPIHPWASPPLDVPGPTLILSPFVEPQLRLGPSRLRLLAGMRVYSFPDTSRLGLLVEGAALWGQDGRGGVLGAGLSYDLIERTRHTQPWTVSLVARRTWTNRDARFDFSVDVAVPLTMFRGSPMEAGAAPGN
ncbi:hypothetical protein P2318_17330 [Myxococcaceae bacterium GXIMD 01537]